MCIEAQLIRPPYDDDSDTDSPYSSSCTSSTESNSDFHDNNTEETSLLEDLRDFAISTNQSHASMNILDLLQKLQKHHPYLPKDSRTLLNSKPNDAARSYSEVYPQGNIIILDCLQGWKNF